MSIFPIGAKVGADTSAFIGSIGAASGSLKAFAGSAGLATGALGVFAGAAVMGAAVKAAMEYQTELVKLNTLVGISTEQIEAWDESIKNISQTTGQMPADLARALFTITSGGARGAEAMEILEQAAKASSVGLGDMAEVGRATTAAVTAFAGQALEASEAVDVMLATVREGNLEAESLAPALGKVMGTAAAMGVTFQDTGAFIATYTRAGVSAAEASTGLQAVLSSLLKPTEDQSKALGELGLSAQGLRDQIRGEGLPATLITLRDAIGDNETMLGRVIPNVRALRAILSTTGDAADGFVASAEGITDSVGDVDASFETWGDTTEATVMRFKASVATAGIALGETLLPPLTLLLQTITPLIGAFGALIDKIDDLARYLGSDMAEDFEKLVFLLHGVSWEATQTSEEVDAFTESLKGMTSQELIDKQAAMRAEVRELLETWRNGGRGAEAARRELDRLGEELPVIGAMIKQMALAQEEANTSTADAAQLTAEQAIAAAELKLELDEMLKALELEELALREGERAVLAKTLADQGAEDVMRDRILAQFDVNAGLEEEARLIREREREEKRAADRQQRETIRQAEERRRALEREAEAKARAFDRRQAEEYGNALRELTQISQEFAQTIGDAFFDVVTGAESVGEAFRNMVNDIIRQIARLAIQKAIVEPLVNAAVGALSPGSETLSAADVTSGVTGFGDQLKAGGIPLGGTGVQSLVAEPTTVVMQNITLSPNLIDGASGAQWLRQQSGEIARIVGESAQQSSQFAAQLGGR